MEAQDTFKTAPMLTVAMNDTYFDRLGVEDAISSFLGSPSQASGSSSSAYFNSVKLNHGTSVEIVEPNRNLSVGLRNSYYAGSDISLFFEFGFKTGTASYYLPQGLKPFIEPISIQTKQNSIETLAGTSLKFDFAPLNDLNINFGLQSSLVHIETHVFSPILKIRSFREQIVNNYFVSLGGEFGDDNKIRPILRYNQYEDGFSEVSFKLKLLLTH